MIYSQSHRKRIDFWTFDESLLTKQYDLIYKNILIDDVTIDIQGIA